MATLPSFIAKATAADLLAAQAPLPPKLTPSDRDLKDFDIRGDARQAFTEVARAFGLECTFDPEYEAGNQLRIGFIRRFDLLVDGRRSLERGHQPLERGRAIPFAEQLFGEFLHGRAVEQPTEGRRVLLLPSPGEQHTFGLVMVGEFFRRAGWDVSGGAWTAGADAAALVAAEWFDVIGFSLGAEIHLPALADCIRAVKQGSCNRSIAVLVGGPLFGEHPHYVRQVGADGMTIDGREAPSLAERLIADT